MAVMTYKPIYVGNAYLVRSCVETYVPADDAYEPYTGGGILVSFARNSDGTNPITGLQNLAMNTDVSGVFHRVLSPAELTGLPALVGQVIYQIVTGGPYNGLRAVTALKVSQPRWAQ